MPDFIKYLYVGHPMMNFRFHQTTVSDPLVTLLFELHKKQEAFDQRTMAKNCEVSFNVIDEIPLNFKTELTGGLFNGTAVHYMHILKYNEQGVLDYHDHERFERYSYVLHMDDSGGTLFQDDKEKLLFKSRRGNLIVFDSTIPHKAVNDNKIRYTAAGGIFKK